MENKTNGKKKKVILVDASRIMRDMLIRAIESKSDSLEIDRKILITEDLQKAQKDGSSLDADWIIALDSGSVTPLPLMDAVDSNPRTKLLILSTDGSQVVLRWFEEKTRVVDRLDLTELMEILKSNNNNHGQHS